MLSRKPRRDAMNVQRRQILEDDASSMGMAKFQWNRARPAAASPVVFDLSAKQMAETSRPNLTRPDEPSHSAGKVDGVPFETMQHPPNQGQFRSRMAAIAFT
jgi:hypothetical protein